MAAPDKPSTKTVHWNGLLAGMARWCSFHSAVPLMVPNVVPRSRISTSDKVGRKQTIAYLSKHKVDKDVSL
jgi:hypothetical protein